MTVPLERVSLKERRPNTLADSILEGQKKSSEAEEKVFSLWKTHETSDTKNERREKYRYGRKTLIMLNCDIKRKRFGKTDGRVFA